MYRRSALQLRRDADQDQARDHHRAAGERSSATQVGGLKLNLDGCPHACAQHWTGDIGLQGTTGRGPNGEPLEAFDIILRGGLGKDAAIGKPILRRVPSALVEDYVSRLFAGYLEQRAADESFTQFCVRTPDADLIAIAHDAATARPAAAGASR